MMKRRSDQYPEAVRTLLEPRLESRRDDARIYKALVESAPDGILVLD